MSARTINVLLVLASAWALLIWLLFYPNTILPNGGGWIIARFWLGVVSFAPLFVLLPIRLFGRNNDKPITKGALAALVFVVLTVVAIRFLPGTPANVRVVNNTREAIIRGQVALCAEKADLPLIQPNGEAALKLMVKGDCHYEVTAILASGKRVTGSVGYVTDGIAFNDELLVLADRVELGQRHTQ